jgi:ABC-2 type transport system permease protein
VIGLLRSELLKQRTTRTSITLLAWMVGLVVLVVALHVLSFRAGKLAEYDNQLRILGLGTTIAALFAALLGGLSMTTEFRYGTIRPTMLVTPRRERVLAAKLGASALGGAAVGIVAEGLTAAGEAIGLGVRGIHVELGTGDYLQLLAGGALAGALFAAIGVGVGALVRNQAATVAGFAVWLLFLEPILLGDVASAAKYAPEAAAGGVAGAIQSQIGDALVAPALGALLLALYAAAAAVAGSIAIARRDVG